MLVRNDVVVMDDQHLRVLSIDASANVAWLFPIHDPTGLPERHDYAQLSRANRPDAMVTAVPRQLSETAMRRAQTAFSRLEPLVADPRILIPHDRNRLIQERAQELGCSPQTILKDLRRYWAGGQTVAALAGLFHKCGCNTERTYRRGRKPVYLGHDSFLIDGDDQKHMHSTIVRHYLKSSVVSLPAAHQRLREEHYSYTDGNGVRFLKPAGEYPSLKQFRYYLNKHFSLEERLRGRQSDKDFERNHRPKLGFALEDCHGVGHIYELDATIADVWLVATKDRTRIIGKPTLYLIYDKFSRLVVGFYVGLEAPSWPAAMQAIVSIAEDKAALCRRYGITYDPAEWPAHSLFPDTIVGDRGEMLSRNSSLLTSTLNITVKNEPALRPDRKGTVECGFKLIQRSMSDSVPGYEPPENAHKRRAKKYDKDACLNLDEFTGILIASIIAHNRTAMKGYPVPATLLCENVKPVPIDIWNSNIKARAGALTRYDENTVRFSLLPTDRGTVTREGIYFNGCHYTCPEALQRGWFVKAGQRRFQVPLSYDRRLVDAIYLHDEGGDAPYIEAVLTERSRDYKGLSFAEVDAYEYMRARLRHECDDMNAHERNEFHQFADPIAKAAKREMRQAAKGKSRSSRKKDVAADRIEERRSRRQQEAVMASGDPGPMQSAQVIPIPAPPADKVASAPTLQERLQQKRKEMLHG